jgi:hypothetical protein
VAEVIYSISSSKNKNFSGYDGLSNKALKLCGNQISKSLTYIYNLSLNSAICADRLKYANIKPCFKKGDKLQMTNYRPISLLTGFPKIFERLMMKGLRMEHETDDMLGENCGP